VEEREEQEEREVIGLAGASVGLYKFANAVYP
jgi:hypothetical protein